MTFELVFEKTKDEALWIWGWSELVRAATGPQYGVGDGESAFVDYKGLNEQWGSRACRDL